MDIIPSDLATYGGEAKNLLQDLQSRNERMFLVTFLVVNMANSKRKLDNDVFAAAGIAQKYNCALTRLDFQQEEGLMSSIPLGRNEIEIQRGLTTSSTAVFIPFITQELFQGGEALYYGLNALSNNMILCDRKQLKNPNGLILGTPGSGKSFAAKREITNAFLITDDDIYISDPEDDDVAVGGSTPLRVVGASLTARRPARPAPGVASTTRRSARRAHGAQLLLQVPDLVAQPGRQLEVQVLGGGVHLGGELGDEVGQVPLGGPGQLLAHGGLGGPLAPRDHRPLLVAAVAAGQQLGGVHVLAGEHVGHVCDLLAQGLRVDPVGVVEMSTNC